MDAFLRRDIDPRTSEHVAGAKMADLSVVASCKNRGIIMEAAGAAVVLAARNPNVCAVAASGLALAVSRAVPPSGEKCTWASAAEAETQLACMQLVLNSAAATLVVAV